MKILTSIPSYSGWVRQELLQFLQTLPTTLYFPPRLPTDIARNNIVKTAQLRKFDAIFMLDYDAVPHPDTFPKFLRQIEQEVCVCAAPSTQSCGAVTVLNLNGQYVCQGSGVERVGNVATHTVMYHIKCFDNMVSPFEFETNVPRTQLFNSEDYVCHDKLTKKNIPIYCFWDCWSDHIKEKRYSRPYILQQ